MKKYNYFDDIDDVQKSKKTHAALAFTRPVAKKLKNAKRRIDSGESPGAIIAGALSARRGLVRFSIAAMCVLFLALAVGIPAAVINGNVKKENAFKQDAGAVCSAVISEYGSGKAQIVTESSGDTFYALTGISYARQLDFDSDSKYELLTAYENGGEYFIEVWGYSKGEFTQIFSVAANTGADVQTGAWISLYNNRGRYYIGVMTDDGVTMQLYTKSGGKFKEKKECRYDAENDIYAIDDKINERDFETVRLSYISGTEAQNIIDSVSEVLEQLEIAETAAKETGTEPDSAALYALYAETVESLQAEYGEAEYEKSSGICSATGVGVVRLIDFNGDETPEMLVIYGYDKRVLSTAANGDSITVTEPAYKLQIYAAKGGEVKMIYETDSLTTFQGSDTEQFYILQKDGKKTNLCTNTYSYSSTSTRVWKATSRIRAMSDSLKFETAFTAVANCNWGYMSYSIDGAVVYSREFAARGYAVPYFCTDSGDYDKDEFTVGFVRGGVSYASEIQSTVDETKAQIKELYAAK